MENKNRTARYECIESREGKRYRFFCDCSGAVMAEVDVFALDEEEALRVAWEEGKEHFNLCHSCGAWVSDVMYNPDVLACVLCAPLEEKIAYCPSCGMKTKHRAVFCERCGTHLLYGGGTK